MTQVNYNLDSSVWISADLDQDGISSDNTSRYELGGGELLFNSFDENGERKISNKILFGEGISEADIQVSAEGPDLVITLMQEGSAGGDRIIMQEAVIAPDLRIDELSFSDGSVKKLSDFPLSLNGSSMADMLMAITGFNVDFRGGGGDDRLYGDSGDNRYLFSRGDGQDLIRDTGYSDDDSGVDSLVFGDGITPQELILGRQGNDYVLQVLADGEPQGDSITLQYAATSERYAIENFSFSNGETLDFETLKKIAQPLEPGDFLFSRNDGQQQISPRDDDGGDAAWQRIVLDNGISPDDIRITASDSVPGALTLELLKNGIPTGDQLQLDWALQGGYSLDTLVFRDLAFGENTELSLKSFPVSHIGDEGNNTLSGVYGRMDLFDGGGGDDLLVGSIGEDRFIYAAGDGHDRIDAMSGSDSIQLTEGLSLSDLSAVERDGNIVIQIASIGKEAGSITLLGKSAESLNGQSIMLADGTQVTVNELLSDQAPLSGELFSFSRGDGQKVLDDSDRPDSSEPLVGIALGDDINRDDIRLVPDSQNSDGLVLILLDNGQPTGDQLTLAHATLSGFTATTLTFSDGGRMSLSQVPVEHSGSEGDDSLAGLYGHADRFHGGNGDDHVIGSKGVDQLVFNTGDDHDRFEKMSGGDQIVFGDGISAEDLHIMQQGSDISISVLVNGFDVGDRITVVGHSDESLTSQSLVFANGSTVQLRTLLGDGEPPVLEGHPFARGDGEYRISLEGEGNEGSWDSILFDEGIEQSDLQLTTEGDNLVLQLLTAGQPGGDSIVLEGAADSAGAVDSLLFAEGSPVALNSLPVQLQGTADANSLSAVAGYNNHFHAGAGDDQLQLGNGADSIWYDRSDGNDSLKGLGGEDRLIFGEDVKAEDLQLEQQGDDLVLTVLAAGFDVGDQLVLKGLSTDQLSDQIVQFADGSEQTLKSLLGGDPVQEAHEFARGDGEYRIDLSGESDVGNWDSILFKDGIEKADLQLIGDGENLVLQLLIDGQPGSDRIVLEGAAEATGAVDTLLFVSGTPVALDSLSVQWLGDEGDNSLSAVEGHENHFRAGQGDDLLQTGDGVDRIWFNRGDDSDTVNDLGSGDWLIFGDQIGADDLRLEQQGEDLVITVLAGGFDVGDQLTLKGINADSLGTQKVQFADGSSALLNGLLEGEGIQEAHPFARGDGEYRINLSGQGSEGLWDSILFDEGITATDLELQARGDDLVLQLLSDGETSDDRIILTGAAEQEGVLDTLLFAEGKPVALDTLAVQHSGSSRDDSFEAVSGYENNFHAGKGNDQLQAGAGVDRILFNRGDDRDTVKDLGVDDWLVFGKGIDEDDLQLTQQGDDLTLTVLSNDKAVGDQLILADISADDLTNQRVLFEDGSSMSLKALVPDVTAIEGHPFERGDGEYRISLTGEGDAGLSAKVLLGSSIGTADIRLETKGDDLIIQLLRYGRETTDRIVLEEAADARTLVDALVFEATSAEPVEKALNSFTVQHKGDGSDNTLSGVDGYANRFYGSEGDDLLRASDETDQFFFDRGDGEDTIHDLGSEDQLVLGNGIAERHLQASVEGGDTVISLLKNGRETGDKIVLDSTGLNDLDGARIVFEDGSSVAIRELIHSVEEITHTGTKSADSLEAVDGATNHFHGLAGDDRLYGGDQADQFHFGRGDDDDQLFHLDSSDSITFAEDIHYNDLKASLNGEDIVINVTKDGRNQGDTLTLKGVAHDTDAWPELALVHEDNVPLRTLMMDSGLCVIESGTERRMEAGDFNTLLFDQAIEFADISIGVDGDDLVMTLVDGGRLTLDGAVGNPDIIQTLSFVDEQPRNFEQQFYRSGGNGSDHLTGTQDQTVIFQGGKGNDRLNGSTADDFYYYNRGDGADTLTDAGGHDRLVFGADIDLADVRVAESGDDLVLTLLSDGEDSGDTITIKEAGLKSDARVETLEFRDGTTLALEELMDAQVITYGTQSSETLNGTAGRSNFIMALGGNDTVNGAGSADHLFGGDGNDTLHGKAGSDYLDGGSGTDYLHGLKGADSYYFDTSSGTTYIYETSEHGIDDTLVLGKGIEVDNLRLTKYSANDMRLYLLTDKGVAMNYVELKNAAKDADYQIENLKFSDGTIMQLTDLPVEWHGDSAGRSYAGLTGQKNSFYGYRGNDTFTGSTEADLYFFNRGDGADTITEKGGQDRIVFGEDISVGDIRIDQSHDQLIITLLDADGEPTGDQLKIYDARTLKTAEIELLEFSDGRTRSVSELLEQQSVIHATQGNDTLHGNREDNHLRGEAGNDTLYGYEGDDYLDGGIGTDHLHGAAGNDSYYFDMNSGVTYIYETSEGKGADTLILGKGIGVENIRLTKNGNDLRVNLLSDNGIQLNYAEIKGGAKDGNYHIENLRFSDGTTMRLADLPVEWHGDAYGRGYTGVTGQKNSFFAHKGNDSLTGSTNDDSYYFNQGDGSDTVFEKGGNDRIVFGEGITPDDILIVQSGNYLGISIRDEEGKETGDLIWLADGRTLETARVETLEFSDGSTRSVTALLEAQDRVYGTDSGNTLYGTEGDDWFIAGGGTDTIYAGNGDDVLDAGTGTSKLYGGAGADSYHFTLTSGNAEIFEDSETGAIDRLVLGEGITVDNIRLTAKTSYEDLYVNILNGKGDVLHYARINDGLRDAGYQIEKLEFSDGKLLDLNELPVEWYGTALTGRGYSQSLTGLEGQKNSFFNEKGVHTFTGSTKEDHYYFDKGDGIDTIIESGGSDRIIFGEGIGADDIRIAHRYDDLVICLLDEEGEETSDIITLSKARVLDSAHVETLEFHDGSTKSLQSLLDKQTAIYGTAAGESIYGSREDDYLLGFGGSDALYAGAGDDVLDAGTGTASLHGGKGADTYHFNLTTGNTEIYETADAGKVDTLQFGAGISASSLELEKSGSSDLKLWLLNGNGAHTTSITIDDALVEPNYQIEQLKFSDGNTMTLNDFSVVWVDPTKYNYPRTLTGLEGHKNSFRGLLGNDILNGSTKTDTYYFDQGDGQDWINEKGGTDRIVFGEGIKLEDVQIAQNGGNYIVTFLDMNGDLSNDRITINGARSKSSAMVEELEFQDGSVHKMADILKEQSVIYGTDVADTLEGTRQADTLEGGAGGDTLEAGAGNDVLDGGTGNDKLYGGKGSDTYLFDYGSGTSTIYEIAEGGETDILLLGSGIEMDDVRLDFYNNDLYVRLLTEQGRVSDTAVLSGALSGSQDHIEQLKFADGSTQALRDMTVEVTGDSSANRLYGAADMDNQLYGKGGDDYLHGKGQDDTYLFNRGDGKDIIYEAGGSDRIQFGADITADDLKIVSSGNNLVVQLWEDEAQTRDQLTLSGAKINADNRVEAFEFADDSSITLVELLAQSEEVLV